MSAPWFFDPLTPGAFQSVVIDPPWKFSAGTKSRPQHYQRMTLDEIKAMPVRKLLLPEGGRVFLWITAPLIHRVPEIAKAWRLRYSSMIPWIKLWNGEDGMFVYASSIARGTGLEVMGNAEYVVILKAGKPASIKGRPFSGVWIEPRREHSRKPLNLHQEIDGAHSRPPLRDIRAPVPRWLGDVGQSGDQVRRGGRMKAATPHPLADMDVTLPDGRRAKVLKVYEACCTAAERCLVAIPEGAGNRTLTIKPAADLKVAR